jgi:hypothetical protein
MGIQHLNALLESKAENKAKNTTTSTFAIANNPRRKTEEIAHVRPERQ